MKKLILVIAALMMVLFSGCASFTHPGSSSEPIGYAIVPYEDGDEQVEIYGYDVIDGTISCTTENGGKIVSNLITLVIY